MPCERWCPAATAAQNARGTLLTPYVPVHGMRAKTRVPIDEPVFELVESSAARRMRLVGLGAQGPRRTPQLPPLFFLWVRA